jgi:hypothetical protein
MPVNRASNPSGDQSGCASYATWFVNLELTVERTRIVVDSAPMDALCPCCAGVHLISAEAAALLSSVQVRTVYRWADLGKIHFAETPQGLLLVCPNSLGRSRGE